MIKIYFHILLIICETSELATKNTPHTPSNALSEDFGHLIKAIYGSVANYDKDVAEPFSRRNYPASA
jgi:hypothetical protein